jgi:hypothetical protein
MGIETQTKLTPARVNELIEILDERFTQLQPRDCAHLMHALIELRDLREVLSEIETICTESSGACRKRMGTRVGNVLVTARAALRSTLSQTMEAT